MCQTPDLRVRPTGSASGGPRAPRYGQLAGRSVFNTPYLFLLFPSVMGVLRLWSVSFNSGCKTEQESRQTEAATC